MTKIWPGTCVAQRGITARSTDGDRWLAVAGLDAADLRWDGAARDGPVPPARKSVPGVG
jgi:hypothetical protein